MTGTLILDPLVPMMALYAVIGLAALSLSLAIWRRLPGWWLRGLAGLALLVALANPAIQQEDREPLTDISRQSWHANPIASCVSSRWMTAKATLAPP